MAVLERGVVLQVHRRHVIVLTPSGAFVRVPRACLRTIGGIGEEVAFQLPSRRRRAVPLAVDSGRRLFRRGAAPQEAAVLGVRVPARRTRRRWIAGVAVAAAMALVVVPASGDWFNQPAAYAHVSVDLAPGSSIDFAVDGQGRVVHVSGSGRAAALLKTIHPKGQTVDQAVSAIVGPAIAQGWVSTSAVVIAYEADSPGASPKSVGSPSSESDSAPGRGTAHTGGGKGGKGAAAAGPGASERGQGSGGQGTPVSEGGGATKGDGGAAHGSGVHHGHTGSSDGGEHGNGAGNGQGQGRGPGGPQGGGLPPGLSQALVQILHQTQSDIRQEIERAGGHAAVIGLTFSGNSDDGVEGAARQAGLSIGQYVLYEAALRQGISLDLADVRAKGIIQALKDAGVPPGRVVSQSELAHHTVQLWGGSTVFGGADEGQGQGHQGDAGAPGSPSSQHGISQPGHADGTGQGHGGEPGHANGSGQSQGAGKAATGGGSGPGGNGQDQSGGGQQADHASGTHDGQGWDGNGSGWGSDFGSGHDGSGGTGNHGNVPGGNGHDNSNAGHGHGAGQQQGQQGQQGNGHSSHGGHSDSNGGGDGHGGNGGNGGHHDHHDGHTSWQDFLRGLIPWLN